MLNLVERIRQLNQLFLFTVACITILVSGGCYQIPPPINGYPQVYDYLSTLPREVSLIWPAQWSVMKVLFLVTRYLPFIDLVVRISCTEICRSLAFDVIMTTSKFGQYAFVEMLITKDVISISWWKRRCCTVASSLRKVSKNLDLPLN